MNDREERREYDRKWRAKNVQRIRAYRRQYYAEHKDQFQIYRKTYAKKRSKTSPLFGGLKDLINPLAAPCFKRQCRFLNVNGIPSCDYIKFYGPRPCPPGKACTVWEKRTSKKEDEKS